MVHRVAHLSHLSVLPYFLFQRNFSWLKRIQQRVGRSRRFDFSVDHLDIDISVLYFLVGRMSEWSGHPRP